MGSNPYLNLTSLEMSRIKCSRSFSPPQNDPAFKLKFFCCIKKYAIRYIFFKLSTLRCRMNT